MLTEILHLVNEMSPYLLLGFFIAGLMHAFVPSNLYKKYLSKHSFRSVVNAALLGIPLPLCSCGVIPTAMSLRKEGASKSAVVSFLIATPQTGVDSIVATYSLMGLPFAIIRPVVALLTALFGGAITNVTDKENTDETDEKRADECCCGSDSCHCHEEETCCCHHEDNAREEESCCCHHDKTTKNVGFIGKMKEALQYAFIDMIDDIGKWLVIGIVIAALITVFVPNEWMAAFKDNSLLSMLLVLAISVPMYVCATGSIPIAVALMMKGLTPGAGLVLLMAGPAANMASILVIRHRLGTKTLVSYIVSIVAGAVVAGLIIDLLLPREWFTASLEQLTCCQTSGTPFQWTCTVFLTILLIYALFKHLSKGKSGHHCSCCHE